MAAWFICWSCRGARRTCCRHCRHTSAGRFRYGAISLKAFSKQSAGRLGRLVGQNEFDAPRASLRGSEPVWPLVFGKVHCGRDSVRLARLALGVSSPDMALTAATPVTRSLSDSFFWVVCVFGKKELGGHFPKYFLHLTQSSHVLDGHPHFAPPCSGSWHR